MSGTPEAWRDDYRRVTKLVDALMAATTKAARAADVAGHDEWRATCNVETEAHLALLEAVSVLAKCAHGQVTPGGVDYRARARRDVGELMRIATGEPAELTASVYLSNFTGAQITDEQLGAATRGALEALTEHRRGGEQP